MPEYIKRKEATDAKRGRHIELHDNENAEAVFTVSAFSVSAQIRSRI